MRRLESFSPGIGVPVSKVDINIDSLWSVLSDLYTGSVACFDEQKPSRGARAVWEASSDDRAPEDHKRIRISILVPWPNIREIPETIVCRILFVYVVFWAPR